MRFLKKKVAKAQQIFGKVFEEYLSEDEEDSTTVGKPEPTIRPKQAEKNTDSKIHIKEVVVTKKVERLVKSRPKDEAKAQLNSAKNIVKNFGRAISSFCLSDIALPYLEPLVNHEDVKLPNFHKFVSHGKENIDGIASFRGLLLVMKEDNRELRAYKQILQEMSIVFIKYFSVNWIFSSRLKNRTAHLKSRFKMLRRIKDPEHFTYLKASS